MSITKIGKKNARFFDGLLFETAQLKANNIIKLGAIEDGVACGAAVFEVGAHNGELISIFVAPEYRRRGIASKLISTFASLAHGTELGSLTASYIPVELDGLNELFKHNGFDLFESSPSFSISFSEAQQSESLNKYLANVRASGIIFPYAQLADYHKTTLGRLLSQFGVSLKEISAGNFSSTLSYTVLNDSGQVESCMFCSDFGDRVGIDLLISVSSSAAPTLGMFKCLYAELEKRGQSDLKIHYLAANPKVLPIADKLLGASIRNQRNAMYAVKLLAVDTVSTSIRTIE